MKQIKLFNDCCGIELEWDVNTFCENYNVIDVKIVTNPRHICDTIIMVVYEVEKCQQ